jgi:hypothetical protein
MGWLSFAASSRPLSSNVSRPGWSGAASSTSELYFDATHVLADAAMDSLAPRFAVEARAAIQAHLDALFADNATTPLESPAGPNPEQTEAARPPAAASPTSLPAALSALEREGLAAANAARHDWIAQAGRPQREVHGLYQCIADVRISTTAPDATPITPSMVARSGSSWASWWPPAR